MYIIHSSHVTKSRVFKQLFSTTMHHILLLFNFLAPPDVTVTYCEVLRGVLKINCFVEAYPPPNVTWYKDGKKLSLRTAFNKTKYFVSSNQTDGQNYHSVLKKYHPDKTTFGNYTCLAENMHGKMAVTRIYQCEMSECFM